MLTQTGTLTPFGYAGQYTDAESGLQYLRARYYDPATQQFLTVDPLLAQTDQAYAYAGGSPTNATDPSGLCETIQDCYQQGNQYTGGGGSATEGASGAAGNLPEAVIEIEGGVTRNIGTVTWSYDGSGTPHDATFHPTVSSTSASSLASSSGGRCPATFGTSTSNDYKGTFFAQNPDLEGKVIVHHAVEQQVLNDYPGILTSSEMHSYENLRGIPKDINGQVHLSWIRMMWNDFYKANPSATKQTFLDQATTIDDLFGHLFDPPVR